jgi:hypothetical protein
LKIKVLHAIEGGSKNVQYLVFITHHPPPIINDRSLRSSSDQKYKRANGGDGYNVEAGYGEFKFRVFLQLLKVHMT